MVKTRSVIIPDDGNNKLCKVAPAAGTGFGLLSSPFENLVSTASWKECQNAKKSAWIFGKKKKKKEFLLINIICITIEELEIYLFYFLSKIKILSGLKQNSAWI